MLLIVPMSEVKGKNLQNRNEYPWEPFALLCCDQRFVLFLAPLLGIGANLRIAFQLWKSFHWRHEKLECAG